MQYPEQYFDANATTPVSQLALEELQQAQLNQWMNPGSPYAGAAAVHRKLEQARESIANYFGKAPGQLIFVSGATEANNMVIQSAARSLGKGAGIAISAIEHPSVLEPGRFHFTERCQMIAVNSDGRLSLAALEDLLSRKQVGLVSIMAANNETGIVQPWEGAAELCHRYSVPFHCDASQWVGKMALNGFEKVDYISACAHKFGGPKGIGFLLVTDQWGTVHGSIGGGQENQRRAGTECYPAVAAMTAALDERYTALSWKEQAAHRDDFVAQLTKLIPSVQLVGGTDAARLPNTIALEMPQFKSTRWTALLDKAGFQVSTGSACASDSEGPSHVLTAMGLSAARANRVLRISSGWWQKKGDWQRLCDAFSDVFRELRAKSSPNTSSVIDLP